MIKKSMRQERGTESHNYTVAEKSQQILGAWESTKEQQRGIREDERVLQSIVKVFQICKELLQPIWKDERALEIDQESEDY